MDEASVTPLSITLVESPAHASTTWSMSDDQSKPSEADVQIF